MQMRMCAAWAVARTESQIEIEHSRIIRNEKWKTQCNQKQERNSNAQQLILATHLNAFEVGVPTFQIIFYVRRFSMLK